MQYLSFARRDYAILLHESSPDFFHHFIVSIPFQGNITQSFPIVTYPNHLVFTGLYPVTMPLTFMMAVQAVSWVAGKIEGKINE